MIYFYPINHRKYVLYDRRHCRCRVSVGPEPLQRLSIHDPAPPQATPNVLAA